MQKVWIELPELVELGWKRDLRDMFYHRQINRYQGIIITFSTDKIRIEWHYDYVEQYREEDLVGQIERMMSGIDVY